jgi:phosphomannomutase
VAFAVRERGVDAAVMITASHNPARDNGLKVFAADGAQIVAPADRRIAAILAELPLAADAPPGPGGGAVRHLGGPAVGGEVVERYVSRAIGLSSRHRDGRAQLAAPLQVVHTSLHGVGDRLLRTVLDRVDGLEAHPVSAQQHPDPDFPTVSSPNPEHHATLELLLHDARDRRADVALALDPDADRLAVALPARSTAPDAASGAWDVMSGDELGALLAAHLLGSTSGTDRLMTTTVVSSRLVPAMCDAAGVLHVETLTGFKWLCRPAIDHPERRQLLAYEEALGYAVGADARDKDGITAAVTLLDAVARWRAEGVGPWDVLDDLARRHGAHVTCNGSLQLAATTPWTGRMDAWASTPPDALGGLRVVDADRPASDVLRWWLEDRTRVVVRPSGTEPMVKYYGEAIEPVRGDPAAAREAARRRLEPVVAEVVALLRG